MLHRIKRMIANWLLKDIEIESLRVRNIKVGDNTVVIKGDGIVLPALTVDPTLEAGKIWIRGDLSQLRFTPDGSVVKSVLDPADISRFQQYSTDPGGGTSRFINEACFTLSGSSQETTLHSINVTLSKTSRVIAVAWAQATAISSGSMTLRIYDGANLLAESASIGNKSHTVQAVAIFDGELSAGSRTFSSKIYASTLNVTSPYVCWSSGVGTGLVIVVI